MRNVGLREEIGAASVRTCEITEMASGSVPISSPFRSVLKEPLLERFVLVFCRGEYALKFRVIPQGSQKRICNHERIIEKAVVDGLLQHVRPSRLVAQQSKAASDVVTPFPIHGI